MHPIKPSLNGKNLSKVKDKKGKLFIQEMSNIAKTKRGGVVEYYWSKPGHNEPVLKISYVELFKPWGWVIGTGVYTDDIEAQIKEIHAISSNTVKHSIHNIILVSLDLTSVLSFILNILLTPNI